MRMNRDLKDIIEDTISQFVTIVFAASVIISFISLPFGFVSGGGKKGCSYESIAAYWNIPYRIGCELTKPRFKENGDD